MTCWRPEISFYSYTVDIFVIHNTFIRGDIITSVTYTLNDNNILFFVFDNENLAARVLLSIVYVSFEN